MFAKLDASPLSLRGKIMRYINCDNDIESDHYPYVKRTELSNHVIVSFNL